ncbi:nucleotide exchange factor GrpE [Myxosarcina sp. GI1]|uniref:nucleotide exchange factor GrpE n=1 Tax=Myxosarcina sp. GI1 TaxID=1541065 RepID=UPI000562179B|nr:nucleotide exchange factor GrpE [Myxosarcina sp. GI1]
MIEEQKQPETNNIANTSPTEQDHSEFETEQSVTTPSDMNVVSEQLSSPEAEKKGNESVDSSTGSESELNNSLEENESIIAAFQAENANLKRLLDEKTEQFERQLQQINNLKAQSTRLAADFENFRRRTNNEKESFEQQIKKNVIVELLPAIDNFERARTQLKPGNEGEKAIHSSYQGVYKTLVDCLKRLGVSAMRPEGEQFDPQYHEAMLREATDEYPEGTVLEQLMRGYVLGDTILRHAMVKVAVPKEPVITSEEENIEEIEQLDSTES